MDVLKDRRIVCFVLLHFFLIIAHDCLKKEFCSKDDPWCLYQNLPKDSGHINVNKVHRDNILLRFTKFSVLDCAKSCFLTSSCDSFNYRMNWKICELVTNASLSNTVEEKACLFSEITTWPKTLAGSCANHNCENGTVCKSADGIRSCVPAYCKDPPVLGKFSLANEKFGFARNLATAYSVKCQPGYIMTGKPLAVCDTLGQWNNYHCCVKHEETMFNGKYPRDCGSIPSYCNSGVYRISPRASVMFDIYCLVTEKSWNVIQYRTSHNVSFERNWSEYENGFGDLYGDFWLGNKNIHYLTSEGNNYLSIHLNLGSDVKKAWYSNFKVGSAESKYQLTIDGFEENDDATRVQGDAMAYHNGLPFSTYDQDNDRNSGSNCAAYFRGGWWFKACLEAHLNGNVAYNGTYAHGIQWYYLTYYEYSLQSSRMMIRKP